MLDGGGDDQWRSASASCDLRATEDSQIVRFRSASNEVEVVAVAAERRRDTGAGVLESGRRLATPSMYRRGVAEDFGDVGVHRRPDFGSDGCRGCMVQVDRVHRVS